ncbi:cyclic nucleotide-binding domain-containing protein [Croceitalea sp. P059]|uniref:cyclic nucleotide-binding domain-containing protein n=1 Tax=Croceitalea sp. P059 TaxID=3075601 RepID=UPI002885A99A|nr:cyclic nucleotide-binding domain-containing protein [Croceitalea sp. P059]MDT0540263.1 cyclic nucleotide-binding domain-containing protein [Croceitalea sp. P059]
MKEEIEISLLKNLFPEGKTRNYAKDTIISDIHREVTTFRWLIQGAFDYFIALQETNQEILVCQISEPFSTIGLSGLLPAKRYHYKTVVSSHDSIFFEVTIAELENHFKKDIQNKLLQNICSKLYHQLRVALLKQVELLQPVQPYPLTRDKEFFMKPEIHNSEIIALMRCSPFLDQFNEGRLSKLAAIAERREYEPYEVLYIQDRIAAGVYILIEGEVSIKRKVDNIEIKQRSISNAGFIFGWSSLIDEKDICSAITTKKTAVYFIDYKDFSILIKDEPSFEEQFYKRLLWLIGNQINAAFLRYIGLLGKYNLQAVFQLIENNKSRLPLTSKFHQINHLLKNSTTKKIAYNILENLLSEGTSLERHLASLSLELLKDDKEELDFIDGLHHIYETVANNKLNNSKQVRKACAKATTDLFEPLAYHIEGWENMPEESGNIFIYNHLINDELYTLNNNFQITLDSHFVSAMLLDKKYGEPGIRTVRIGQGQEYGHQNYYNKLGHINVFTKESEHKSSTTKKEVRSIFYKDGERYLKNGYNLIISPEGTSYKTENSPGPFKLGSFKLALNSKPEPKIIPIVIVNFDKKIKDNLYYCKILAPFKVSEYVKSNSTKDLIKFVEAYQKTYANYVQETIEEADNFKIKQINSEELSNPPEIWSNEIKRLKNRVNKLNHQNDLITFYGSSSIRLWVNMKKDLHPLHVLNLGFGGSSFSWCTHYFSEIFQNVNPSKIVLYAGENDLAEGKTPHEVLADCKELVDLIHQKYDAVELAFISLKPSVERTYLIPQIIETNLLLSKYIIGELNAQFINVFARMITTENRPRPELYLSDGLHLNKKGYAIWSQTIQTALTLNEQEPILNEPFVNV